MPKFSIIVPVYNVAPYLRECLDSVLAQTFADWECLCVDDGSVDASGAILDEYAAKDSRFRIFHKPNGGVSSARNLALGHVKGEWIGFLDGDDVYNPELMVACEDAIADYPSTDMVRFRHVRFNDGEECRWPMRRKEARFFDYQNELSAALFEGIFWGSIYRADRVKDIAFKPYLYGEDVLWKNECVIRLNGLVSLDSSLYGYRKRQGSAMRATATLTGRLSSLYWRQDVWKLLTTTAKHVDKDYLRQVSLSLTEGYSNLYLTAPEAIQIRLRPLWLTILNELAHQRTGSKWVTFSARLISLTGNKCLMVLFFYIPWWLKSKGIHR